MTTSPLSSDKPIHIDGNKVKVSISWILIRLPVLPLTIPSAYGVYGFAREKLPENVAQLAGYAFELAYIGAIAVADQQYQIRQPKSGNGKQSFNTSAMLWWVLIAMSVISSVLANLLFFAGGKYVDITPEIFTHAVFLPVVNLMYNLVIHNAVTNKKHSAVCSGCGRVFNGDNCQDQLNGHKPHCKGV